MGKASYRCPEAYSFINVSIMVECVQSCNLNPFSNYFKIKYHILHISGSLHDYNISICVIDFSKNEATLGFQELNMCFVKSGLK